ncbi:MAG TPA: hypothetical protein VIY30_12515, partial [Burkholderiaceae bacterium]
MPHTPAVHVAWLWQASLATHTVPSLTGTCAGHWPFTHMPSVWQLSIGAHTFGVLLQAPVAHAAVLQVSVGGHEVPFGAFGV